jgi:hypothetical protein
VQDIEPEIALSANLNRLSEIAARDLKVKFTSLAYLSTKDSLKVSYRELNHQQAKTLDHVSYTTYCENLDQPIAELIKRPREKRYRTCDIRLVLIPNLDRRQKPLGSPVPEGRSVWRGVAKMGLYAVYL